MYGRRMVDSAAGSQQSHSYHVALQTGALLPPHTDKKNRWQFNHLNAADNGVRQANGEWTVHSFEVGISKHLCQYFLAISVEFGYHIYQHSIAYNKNSTL